MFRQRHATSPLRGWLRQNVLKGARNRRFVHGTRRTRAARNSSIREERSGFRRRSKHLYGKQDRAQDRAHLRLDKRRPGLAFGSPAKRRCAAGRFQMPLFSTSNFECTVLSEHYIFFVFSGSPLFFRGERRYKRRFSFIMFCVIIFYFKFLRVLLASLADFYPDAAINILIGYYLSQDSCLFCERKLCF